MDSHSILGLAVPTNEPDVAFSYLLATLEHLKEVAPISTFLFNFQKPWTEEKIQKAVKLCEDQGFAVRYAFNSYEIKGKGLVPFNQIRGDACRLMPEAKFFMLMDDDFSFLGRTGAMNYTAGEQLVEIIYYLLNHPDCGFALLKGMLYSKEIQKYEITAAPSIDAKYCTDKGIILRNFDPAHGLVVPDDAISLLGSDEEKVACAWRLYNGLYPAAVNHLRIRHYENCDTTQIDNPPVTGEAMYQWNTKEILDANTNKYIREHFYAKFHNAAWRTTKLISYKQYLEAGGLDVENEQGHFDRDAFTHNYESRSVSADLLSIINHYKEDQA